MWMSLIDPNREIDESIENDIDFAIEQKHQFDQMDLFEDEDYESD